jgi:hypothetical protein
MKKMTRGKIINQEYTGIDVADVVVFELVELRE